MKKISTEKIYILENMIRIIKYRNIGDTSESIAEKMGFSVSWVNRLICQIKKLLS